MHLDALLARARELPEAAAEAARLAPWLAVLRAAGVSGLLRARARRHPERVFLRSPDRRLTWAETDAAVDARVAFWRAQGLAPGDCVALLLGNDLEGVLHPLALERLGATSALINPALTGAPLAHTLRAVQARAVLTDAAHGPALGTLPGAPDSAPEVSASNDPIAALRRGLAAALAPARGPGPVIWRLPSAAPPAAPWAAWEASGLAAPFACETVAGARPKATTLLREASARAAAARRAPGGEAPPFTHLFTSGTTGLPKAAPIVAQRLVLPGLALQAFALHARSTDVLFTPLPLFHASAWIIGFGTALVAGAGFALAPRFSARGYLDDAAAVGATIGVYVGELCRYLVDAPPHPGEGHHRVHTFVGNGLSAGVWPRFQARYGGVRVVEFYGATEGNTLLLNRNGKVGACGRPVFMGPLDGLRLVRYDVETDTHPRDARGHLVPCGPDEVGELIGRIGRLPSERFDGYLDPEATARKVLTDAFAPGDRWFRTGDLLRRDAEGDYFFVDRIGDTFRWKGENISTQEVAETLRRALDAEGSVAAVFAGALVVHGVQVPGHEGRAGMVAFGGAADPAAAGASAPPAVTPEALAALWHAAQALPAAARPAFVRQASALDATGTLKLQKTRLQREGFADCGADRVWVRDDAARTFVSVTSLGADGLASDLPRL